MSFGRVLNERQGGESPNRGWIFEAKENARPIINRKDNNGGSRLRIEKDKQQKLKIVRQSPQKTKPKLVNYNQAKKQVVIDVSDLLKDYEYPPDRIE